MKYDLHPVFYVLLGYSLHPSLAPAHSGQVAMNTYVQVWPSKATGQFVRRISSPLSFPFSSRSSLNALEVPHEALASAGKCAD